MDHILKVRDPVYADLKIPYLCEGWQYTKPFPTYPRRCGVELIDRLGLFYPTETSGEIDRLLQSWLFFGLLQEIFGELFNAAHYIRVDSQGRKLVTTQRLRRTLVEYNMREQTLSRASKSERYKEQSNNLHLARTRLTERKDKCKQRGVLQSLTEVMVSALINFIAKRVGYVNEASSAQNFESGYIERFMVEEGWCPNQVLHLSESLHIETLYMLSRTQRPDPHLRHSSSCMIDCIGNQVDAATYKTKHVCADGDCSFVSADPAKMFDILKSGHRPLIVNKDYSDQHEIGITDSNRDDIYIAISHVWSHGLGNAQRNALPRCQLQRICKIVRELYGPESDHVPFWIDTICCPLQPREARTLAIVNMRHTYKEADAVIVLDANLEMIASKGLWEPEIALRVVCSTWATRLWTLSEGALAALVYLHFADGIISLEKIHKSLRGMVVWPEFGDLLGAVINFRQADFSDLDVPAPGRILFFHGSVRGRSTSRQSDEPVCLAAFAGLDVEKIAEAEGVEDRMYEFWKQISPPPSLMAFWKGPRLTTKGRRWAPSTLRLHFQLGLDLRKASEEVGAKMAEQPHYITDDGILLKTPGLVFEDNRLDSDLGVDGSLGEIEFSVAYPDQKSGFFIRGEMLTGRPAGNFPPRRTNFGSSGITMGSAQYALILKCGRKIDLSSYEETAIDDIALLVRLRNDDQQNMKPGYDPTSVIITEIVCNVSLEKIYPIYDDTETTGSEDCDGIESNVPTLFANLSMSDDVVPTVADMLLTDEQMWRIG